MSDVIAAIATGLQPAAIGILRLSGDGAITVAQQVFTALNHHPLSQAPDRKLILGTLHDASGRPLDQVLATVSRAPASYTGEDTAEFQCHGSPAVLTAALEALFRAGARQAGPGEFTKRAFLNGRMDLAQAEAVIDLIDAETADAAANAAGQLAGAISRRVDPVYDALTDVMAHFHAVLDYPDEEIEPFQLSAIRRTLEDSARSLAALLATYRRGQILRSGVRAVILGKPNVGKSSLLNALAGFDRVIVTAAAGTTRDTVEQSVQVGGVTLRLLDTAGIRQTSDEIEAMGVQRALDAAEQAQLALFVCDGSQPLSPEDLQAMDAASSCPQAIAILNKTDLPQCVTPADLPFDWVVPLSAKTGQGMDLLEQAVETLFASDVPCDGSILTNARQAGAIYHAVEALRRTLDALDSGMTPDAVLTDVESAMEALGEITGKVMREEITARIFQRFCVGK